MAQNFQNLVNDLNLPKHIMLKQLKTKDKEKIIKL